jgi:hypothetical protein
MNWFQRHLTYANVMSTIGVFIALGGVSYAALKLPKNSVGSKQIKANAVKSGKIKHGQVKASDLATNSITGPKMSPGAVDGSKVLDASIGAIDLGTDSVDSTKIANGTVGTDDLADGAVTSGKVASGTFLRGDISVQFNEAGADLGNGAETSLDVHCLPGQTAIGGGARGDLTNSELTKITASRPIISTGNAGAPDDNGTFTGWRGTFVNENNGAGIRPDVWVICAGPPPPAP